MCGLVGMAGSGVVDSDLKVFTDIMKISTLRGVDGTGIFHGNFGQHRPNTYILEKKAMEVNMFFRMQKTDVGNKLLLKSIADNVFLGHTRWATMGGRNEDSCHPFTVGNLVGMHNGTMVEPRYMQKNKTDSELLYEDIDRRGLKTVLEDVDFDSAYALVMFDTDTYDLTFARNNDRDLWVAFHKTRKVMYWASEAEFIICAADRHNVTISDPCYFGSHEIYKMNLKDISYHKDCGFQIEKYRQKPQTKKKETTRTSTYSTNYNGINWMAEWEGVMGNDNEPPFEVSTDGKPTFVGPRPKLTKAERKAERKARAEAARIVANLKKNSQSPAQTAEIVQLSDYQRTLSKTELPANAKTQCPKIPTYSCVSCSRQLKLIDQHFADKAYIKSTNEMIFECKPCVKLSAQIIQHSRTEVVETRH